MDEYWNKYRKIALLAVFVAFLGIPLNLLGLLQYVAFVGVLAVLLFLSSILWLYVDDKRKVTKK